MLRSRRSRNRATPGRRRGVTSTEYAVMLALMLGVAVSSINCLGAKTNQTFQRTGDAISGEAEDGP